MTVNISGDTGVSQVQAGAIEVTDIPNSTITNDKLVDNTITVDKLHTSVQSSLGTRNLIINGDMRIDQRNAGSAVSSGMTLDRFIATGNGFDEVVRSYQQVSDASDDFDYSCKLTVTTAETAFTDNEHIGFAQRIEGQNVAHLQWGTANAKTVTLSFWVKSSLTGTFSGMFQNSARDRSYPFEYTISSANTWEYKTVTVSGDTTGTWLKDNGIGIRVNFNHGCGPDRKGTANTWAGADYRASSTQTVELCENLNATWQITGVQLEVGTEATEFEHRPFDMELHRCQRYFCKSYNYSDAVGTNTWVGTVTERNYDGSGRSEVPLDVNFPVRMRTTPGLTAYSKTGISGYRTSGSTSIDNGTSETTAITLYGSETNIRGTAMAVALNAAIWMQFHYTADAEL